MTNRWSFFLLAATLLLALGNCQRPLTQTAAPAEPAGPLNIILLIGDGMGLAQLSTTFYYGSQTSHFTRFRHIGLHRNPATDAKITDSAAGATAFATGYRSYNAAIGVDADTIARPSILEWAVSQGKRTGLVATSSITHATPACFYAHVPERDMHEAIAAQLPAAGVDFVAGGGIQFFARRTDGLNYLDTLRHLGYDLDTTSLRHSKAAKQAFLLAPDGMPTMLEGRGRFLPDATTQALTHLAGHPQGFFLMVEGSQIDWAGHNNDAPYLIAEMRDFEEAVGLALDFAARDGNTLVVVTADHETGGLSLSAAEAFGRRDYDQLKPTFSTGGHSASLIPVFAFGPGAEAFMGIYFNNDIFHKMMGAWRPTPNL